MTVTAPMYPSFPTGTITPQGWLATQLLVQSDGLFPDTGQMSPSTGLSGHLALFWEDIADSIWVGGPGDTGLHERGTYWLNGPDQQCST